MRGLFVCLWLLVAGLSATVQADTSRTATAPQLLRIGSDTCLLPGQRLRLIGSALGSERQYQLLLISGGTQVLLTIEQWQSTAITAVIPPGTSFDGQNAVLVMRDRITGRLIGNRLSVTVCARSADRPIAAREPEPPGRQPPATNLEAAQLAPPKQIDTIPADGEEADGFEQQEVILFNPDMSAARRLDARLAEAGYRVKRRRQLARLGLVISVIRVPDGTRVPEALQRLRQIDPALISDANHRYRLMADTGETGNAARQLVNWGAIDPRCGEGIRLGLIDTLVDTDHPLLPAERIVSRSFLPLGVNGADRRHATAIASLLIARASSQDGIAGLLPRAQLFNAGVFRRRGEDQIDTTAELIITALDWLQGQQVDAINLSLAGRPNRLLQQVIAQLVQRNQLLIAAAGNAGPQAPPAYPAAWPGVMAVTAVDIRGRVYRQANRGDYIDLAAPGVDIWAARSGSRGAYYSGTSYAAPYATAALAVLRRRSGGQSAEALRRQLREQARDLGAPGPDPVYGHGLLQLPGGCG